jgi:hypothetical protein
MRFPLHTDVIRQDAEALRRLPPRQRVLNLLDLIASGTQLLAHSPHKQVMIEQQRRHEEAWQRAHLELFRKHGL